MGQTLTDESCREFSYVLSARTPIPGGGGAAALVGALAAALCSMSANYTFGKKCYDSVDEDMKRILLETRDLRLCLLDLVDKDGTAYGTLSKMYRIPKENPERKQALERATKAAAEVPIEMMQKICRIIELLEEMNKKGSRLLLSDIGCGAFLACAALQSASLTVFVNTKNIKDISWVKQIETNCDAMLNGYIPRAQAIARESTKRIREGK